ncbi:MAG: type IX secretion system sortase PorU, partial [Spirochaetales bacterium]|nr:type IX secretion system sortase PorU [Spirochaetales bacterium]
MQSVDSNNVSTFRLKDISSSTKVWDITDPRNPRLVETVPDGSNLSFTLATDSLREFIAFNNTGYLSPEVVGSVDNQNLHGMSAPEMIVITHPNFTSYANQIADHHRNVDGMDVFVTTPELIYNEFSSGAPDVSAIRNFMKMFYDRATTDSEIPKYLLLVGDGSYDNKTVSADNTNYILTYQSSNSIKPTSSFVTDDYFAILDDSETITNGSLDLGVGRMAVKSTDEAKAVTDKILHYATSSDCYGDWRNIICFTGDDEDGNQHMSDADYLATYVDTAYSVFNVEKIYLDAYQQVSTPAGQRYPDVNSAIDDRVNRGALIFNYTGHGGELGLAHESVIDINQINSWSNYNQMPLFMTATCEFSRFDDPERTSAGELIQLNPNGGGVGLFTTTRVVYASSNFILSRNFYRVVFESDENGERYCLGDIMRITKNNSSSGIN